MAGATIFSRAGATTFSGAGATSFLGGWGLVVCRGSTPGGRAHGSSTASAGAVPHDTTPIVSCLSSPMMLLQPAAGRRPNDRTRIQWLKATAS